MTRRTALVMLICLGAQRAHADVVPYLPFTGRLTDPGGQPIDADLNITFTFYDAPTDGTQLWQQAYVVPVKQGRFALNIGTDVNAIGATPSSRTDLLRPELFSGPAYLELQIGTDAAMTPRIELGANAFALRSASAEALDCTNCVSGAEITDGSIGDADVSISYAASASKGGAATDLACTECVAASEIADGEGSGLAPDTIVCQKNGTLTAGAGSHTFSFVAADCGGTLPDSTYVGAGTRVEICNGMVTWRVIQPGETDGPAIRIYSGAGPCGGYTMGALFIKR